MRTKRVSFDYEFFVYSFRTSDKKYVYIMCTLLKKEYLENSHFLNTLFKFFIFGNNLKIKKHN